MLLGVAIGIGVRRIPAVRHTGKWVSIVIYILLFLLGKEVGGDKQLLASLSTLGLQALLITGGAVAGSILFATFIFRFFFEKK